MNAEEVERLLGSTGALLRGHFVLSSGRHSDVFVQKFRLFERPDLTVRCGAAIAECFPGAFSAVACPALGAIPLGFSVALAAGARSLIAERVAGRLTWRRGFSFEPGEPALVVEDVVTTGASAAELTDLVRDAGAHPVGIGALVDRSERGSATPLPVPLKALVRLPASSWEALRCPLCSGGEPLEDPGSRRLQA